MPARQSGADRLARVFCNRTWNMRSIQALGFDIDHTLAHHDVPAWEARAYAHVRHGLLPGGAAGDRAFHRAADPRWTVRQAPGNDGIPPPCRRRSDAAATPRDQAVGDDLDAQPAACRPARAIAGSAPGRLPWT